jgi:adhesin transport system outer membrane protein
MKPASLSTLFCASLCLAGAAPLSAEDSIADAPAPMAAVAVVATTSAGDADQQVAPTAPADARPAYGPPSDSEPGQVVVLEAPPGVPLPLRNAADIATHNYPAIRTAEAELRAARSDLRGAKWLRFPSLTVEALAITRGSENASQKALAANATIEQPILTFGKIGGTIDRAEAVWLVRRAQIDETARDIALRVVDAFYGVAAAARRQAILEDGLAQHRTLVDTITNRVQQEISPQSDLDLAISRTAQIEQELAIARAQRVSSYSQLVELVGSSSINLGNVPDYDPSVSHPSEVGALDRALSCDPTLQRLRAEVLIARADTKVAKAGLFPQLLGQLSHNEITGTRAGVALRAQTGAGLSQLSAVTSARARMDASEFNISTAERQLREALRLDFVTNKAARDRVAAGSRAQTTSEMVTESYKRQFIAGRRTWLDVMNAVRESTSSEMSVADAEVGAMASNARIWLRTCGWQPRPLDADPVESSK